MKIFTHARTSAHIADPGGYLEAGLANSSGRGATPPSPAADACEIPETRGARGVHAAFLAALEAAGRMPVAGSRSGYSAGQLALLGFGGGLVALGVIIAGFGHAGALIPGVIFAVFGVAIVVAAAWSGRARRRRLALLGDAWRNGRVSFAPARVGGVWIDRMSTHNERRDRRDHERRYFYRALVEACPLDGTAPFTFTSAEFSAASSWEGTPMGLHMATSVMDALEPEYFNGWTVCRYIPGHPDSATITTDLSPAQIEAGLGAAGVR